MGQRISSNIIDGRFGHIINFKQLYNFKIAPLGILHKRLKICQILPVFFNLSIWFFRIALGSVQRSFVLKKLVKYHQICILFFKIDFIDYAVTVVPFFSPLYSPLPCTSLPPASPHLSSCPWVVHTCTPLPPASPHLSSCSWVVHISSLASPFPILFLTSHCLFLYLPFMLLFLRFYYLFIFRERGREGEREEEKRQCVVASQVPPVGDLASNPGMCPDWESNQQRFGSQAHIKFTELHQAGPIYASYSLYLFPHSPPLPPY